MEVTGELTGARDLTIDVAAEVSSFNFFILIV